MKKIVLIAGLLACSGVWAGVPDNPIESRLKQCISEDESPSGGGTRSCQQVAISDYEKVFKKNDYLGADLLSQYNAVYKACQQPFVQQSITTSSNDDSWILSCQLSNARHFSEVGEFLRDNKE